VSVYVSTSDVETMFMFHVSRLRFTFMFQRQFDVETTLGFTFGIYVVLLKNVVSKDYRSSKT
jgi:hypothetical protein